MQSAIDPADRSVLNQDALEEDENLLQIGDGPDGSIDREMMPEGGNDMNSSSSFSKYKTSIDKLREDSDEEGTTGFWQSIKEYDISFLIVISVCNFA